MQPHSNKRHKQGIAASFWFKTHAAVWSKFKKGSFLNKLFCKWPELEQIINQLQCTLFCKSHCRVCQLGWRKWVMSERSWIKNDLTCGVKHEWFHISEHAVLPSHLHLYLYISCYGRGMAATIRSSASFVWTVVPNSAYNSIRIFDTKAKASTHTPLS